MGFAMYGWVWADNDCSAQPTEVQRAIDESCAVLRNEEHSRGVNWGEQNALPHPAMAQFSVEDLLGHVSAMCPEALDVDGPFLLDIVRNPDGHGLWVMAQGSYQSVDLVASLALDCPFGLVFYFTEEEALFGKAPKTSSLRTARGTTYEVTPAELEEALDALDDEDPIAVLTLGGTGSYVQTAGGGGELTVELREYQGDQTYTHRVAGRSVPSDSNHVIDPTGYALEVHSSEVLDSSAARRIFLHFFSTQKPDPGFHWREVADQ